MTFTKTFKKTAFSALIASALMAAPALAGGSTTIIEQWGWGNGVGVGQTGFHNRARVYQDGWGNTSIATQDGAFNRTAIGQQGHHNMADTDQNGFGNIAGVAIAIAVGGPSLSHTFVLENGIP